MKSFFVRLATAILKLRLLPAIQLTARLFFTLTKTSK